MIEAALQESSYLRIESGVRWTAQTISLPLASDAMRHDPVLLLASKNGMLSLSMHSLDLPLPPADSGILPWGTRCALHIICLALALRYAFMAKGWLRQRKKLAMGGDITIYKFKIYDIYCIFSLNPKENAMNVKELNKAEEIKKTPSAPKPISKPTSAKAPAKAVKKSEPKAAKAAKLAAKEIKVAPKAAKKPKLKVVRDSFTMPVGEYQKIAEIKASCLKTGVQVKKSEVLRAGVIALCSMSEAKLKLALGSLDKIKTGRPNKH